MFLPGSVSQNVSETSNQVPPVGPCPRHIWVHPDAPKDEFDRVCHEIWKRTQSLPEGLKYQDGNLRLKTKKTQEMSNNSNVRSVHGNSAENDISYMIEQEHMSLIIENLSESFSGMNIKECDRQAMDERAEALKIETFIKSLLAEGNSNTNLTLKAKKCYIQDRSSSESRRPDSLDKEDICSIEYTKMEARKLLAQFPIKSADTNNVTITKTEMKVVKNFKKNILTFYKKGGRTSETASKDDKNLKVFAKLCAKAYHHAGFAMPMQAVTPVSGNETENRNGKQAGPVFMPPSSPVAEGPTNQSYMSNFSQMSAFWVANGMNYGQFQQIARPMFYLPYLPMMHYMPYMHPYYQMRGFPKPNPGTRDHPRMAGDGPQYPFPHPNGFNPPISRVAVNSQNFCSRGNCMKPF
ncbi:uncharacterized protein C1orf94 homolog isoform X1 [Rhinoderma darwinii]|uniref:uncharacterized protein C1orf94 homolog isoform X1 n=1 Tax=Rhinoderma darwinii TaxID=43563 RepID=UPI003F675407